jgi:hypothetical protein
VLQHVLESHDLSAREYHEATETLPGILIERMFFNHLGILTPPTHAEEPAVLEKVYETLRLDGVAFGQRKSPGPMEPSTLAMLEKTWKVNCTFLDEEMLVDHCFRPHLSLTDDIF